MEAQKFGLVLMSRPPLQWKCRAYCRAKRSVNWRRFDRGVAVQKTQQTQQWAIQDDSQLGERAEGMRVQPELFKFLEVMGIEEERIPVVIKEARKWWQEVGSYRSGKLVMQEEDFVMKHAESVMFFLLSKGVEVKDLRKIVSQCPQILRADVQDDLAPIIRLLEGLKITGKALQTVLTESPGLLLTGDWKTIASIVEILKRFQLHETKIREIVIQHPQLLSLTLPQLRHNTEILSDLLIMEEDFLLFIIDKPYLLSRSPEILKAIERVFFEIGLEPSDAKASIQKVPKLLLISPNSMGKTINALGRCGFSREKVAELVKMYPRVLLRSAANVTSKLQFLVKSAERDIEEIFEFPMFFDFALSTRVGPRLMFLKLRYPKLYESAVLSWMINTSDKRFAEARAGCLYPEYAVFKEQWIGIYNSKFKSSK